MCATSAWNLRCNWRVVNKVHVAIALTGLVLTIIIYWLFDVPFGTEEMLGYAPGYSGYVYVDPNGTLRVIDSNEYLAHPSYGDALPLATHHVMAWQVFLPLLPRPVATRTGQGTELTFPSLPRRLPKADHGPPMAWPTQVYSPNTIVTTGAQVTRIWPAFRAYLIKKKAFPGFVLKQSGVQTHLLWLDLVIDAASVISRMMLLLGIVPLIVTVRAALRFHDNRCVWCGYDLAGTGSSRCAECGKLNAPPDLPVSCKPA